MPSAIPFNKQNTLSGLCLHIVLLSRSYSRRKRIVPLDRATSGHLHGEFVRFLYFLAHKRAMMIMLFIVLSRNKLRIPLEGTYS